MKCPVSASYRFTWPGSDESFICVAHVRWLKTVAAALDLYLQVIPLKPEEMTKDLFCEQELSKQEEEKINDIETTTKS